MEEGLYKKLHQSNIIYFNGLTVKDRNHEPECKYFNILQENIENKVRIDFWDEKNKILSLKNIH